MKILGAGLSRTGTSSLAEALCILGYSCTHFDVSFVERLKAPVLDLSVYDGVNAITDVPTALFYREFLERYPNLLVVLTVRDEDSWWRSMKRNLELLPISSPTDHRNGWRWPETTWYSRLMAFGWPTANEFVYRKRFREHNEAVKAYVPPERLLVMDIEAGDGWTDLCRFLGVDCPGRDFPWMNRSR